MRFIQAYEKEGVPIWGLTVQNEPMATQTWESASSRPRRSAISSATTSAPRSRRPASRLKIMIWDHNRGILYQRAKAVYDDPAAARYVWGTGFHWYVGDHFDNVRLVHDAWPDKQLLFTEGTPRTSTRRLDEWKWGETTRLDDPTTSTTGRWAGPTGTCCSTSGAAPTTSATSASRPSTATPARGELTYTSSYWYIGHFSKFVRPGARAIACTSNDDDLLATAFSTPRAASSRWS